MEKGEREPNLVGTARTVILAEGTGFDAFGVGWTVVAGPGGVESEKRRDKESGHIISGYSSVDTESLTK